MLTTAEKKAIKTLENLAKRWPKDLWLFSGSGSLYVMKYSLSQDGSGMMKDYRSKSVDPNGIITTINIPNDGGDW